MKLNPEPFNKIKSGLKKYELRLFDEKRQGIRIGDEIEFVKTDGEEVCTVRVAGLHRYDSFVDLYASLPIKDLGYYDDEVEYANPNDMAQYYTEQQQKEYGVVAIEIELLKIGE